MNNKPLQTIPLLKQLAFVGDNWIAAASGASLYVQNPATAELVGSVPNLCEKETSLAISAASEAFEGWAKTPAAQRGRKLRSIRDFLLRNISDLAKLLTCEQGKPLREAEKEIEYSASFFDWFSEEARRTYGEVIPSPTKDHRILVTKEPVGVCAAITPWNFPSAMVARKMAAALAAGCTFICKPASETPFSALAIALAAEHAGLPAGVVNIITGDPEPIAHTLLADSRVRKISFTGSTEVGKLLMQQSAATLKRLTLELGGNAPFIVFEDANIEQAVRGAMFAKYRNAGQTCIGINRFFVHQDVLEPFTAALAAASRKLHVGNGLDHDTDIGPLISREATKKVAELVSEAVQQGASLRLGGLPDPKGPYIYPTILTHVRPEMRICREEIFGPVCTIQSFADESSVIGLANNTEYGLASYFYTKDLSRAVRLTEALQYGMVGVNNTVISFTEAPFGGIKSSGFGREGSHFGIDEYLNLKYSAAQIEH